MRKQIKYFKNAVALDPLHGPAWHYLGVLYGRKGDKKMERFCNEKALEAYKTGLQRYKRELTRQEWKNRNESKKDDPNSPVGDESGRVRRQIIKVLDARAGPIPDCPPQNQAAWKTECSD